MKNFLKQKKIKEFEKRLRANNKKRGEERKTKTKKKKRENTEKSFVIGGFLLNTAQETHGCANDNRRAVRLMPA